MAALRGWKRLTPKQRFWIIQSLWFACILLLALGYGDRHHVSWWPQYLRAPFGGRLAALSISFTILLVTIGLQGWSSLLKKQWEREQV